MYSSTNETDENKMTAFTCKPSPKNPEMFAVFHGKKSWFPGTASSDRDAVEVKAALMTAEDLISKASAKVDSVKGKINNADQFWDLVSRVGNEILLLEDKITAVGIETEAIQSTDPGAWKC